MRQRLLFILFLLLLFVIEGTWLQWMVPDVWGADWTFVPASSLIVVMLVSIYFGPHQGILYGALLGLMYDLAFGHIIGSYVFSVAFIAYFSGQFMQQFQRHSFLILVTVTAGIVLHILIIYGLYTLFGVTWFPFRWMVFRLLLPSVLFNLLFAIILLRPIKRWFTKMGANVEQYE